MALDKSQDIFQNDGGVDKTKLLDKLSKTLVGSRAEIAININTLNKFIGSSALYRDFPDDFP